MEKESDIGVILINTLSAFHNIPFLKITHEINNFFVNANNELKFHVDNDLRYDYLKFILILRKFIIGQRPLIKCLWMRLQLIDNSHNFALLKSFFSGQSLNDMICICKDMIKALRLTKEKDIYKKIKILKKNIKIVQQKQINLWNIGINENYKLKFDEDQIRQVITICEEYLKDLNELMTYCRNLKIF